MFSKKGETDHELPATPGYFDALFIVSLIADWDKPKERLH